jgi:hypothetical protein
MQFSSFRLLLHVQISAFLADPAQLHAVVVDLETEGRGVWNRQLIQSISFEIDELVALKAYEVVVEVKARVEARHATGMAGLGDHSHVREVLEGAVNGCVCDSWQAIFDRVEDQIGRRVVVEIEDRLEDDAALHRATLAALAAQPPEKLDTFCPSRLVQAAAPRFLAIVEMTLDENM